MYVVMFHLLIMMQMSVDGKCRMRQTFDAVKLSSTIRSPKIHVHNIVVAAISPVDRRHDVTVHTHVPPHCFNIAVSVTDDDQVVEHEVRHHLEITTITGLFIVTSKLQPTVDVDK